MVPCEQKYDGVWYNIEY